MIDPKLLYEKNQDFKKLVDAIAERQNKSVDEMLKNELIRNKAEDFKNEMERR